MNYAIYIYYKVTPDNQGQIRLAAQSLQQAINAATGINGRLLCRRDKPDTWMEVYEGVPDADAFIALLDREAARLQFAELLGAGSRRMTELFRLL